MKKIFKGIGVVVAILGALVAAVAIFDRITTEDDFFEED